MRNVSSTHKVGGTRRWSAVVNSLIVMTGYVLSRVLGVGREIVIADKFGTNALADAYQVAFYIPDLLYLIIIGGALGSAFIPVFSELLMHDGEQRAWQLASQVMNLALLVLIVVAATVALLAPQLVALLFWKFDPATQAVTVDLMRIFLLSPLLLGLGGLAMAALNALDRYTLPALAPSVYNLSIIAGAIFLAPRWSIYGVAWGVAGGALLYLLIQVPGLIKAGMRYRPMLGLRDRALRRVTWLMAPRVFGQAAMQLNIIVIGVVAATLGEGRARALGQAYSLMLLPHGIFALSLGTVAFPAMARAFAASNLDEVGRLMRSMLRIVLWTVIPAAVVLAALRLPLVRVIFQHGEFNEQSTLLVASALLLYATALPAFAVSEILIRTFYATQETRTPVIAGLITVTLNVMLAWTLVVRLKYGHAALAGAFSIANNLEALLLVVLLRRRLGLLDPGGEVRRTLRHTLLGAIVLCGALLALQALSTYALPWLFLTDGSYRPARDLPILLGWSVLAGLVALGTYLGLAVLQGAEELQMITSRLRRRRE